jgi:hypothetical protein
MAKVKVYRVNFYDIQSDDMTLSRRWFTREGAERAGGSIIENSAIDIDEADLQGELWTPRDYSPHGTGGLQRQGI